MIDNDKWYIYWKLSFLNNHRVLIAKILNHECYVLDSPIHHQTIDTQELKFFHPSNNNTIFELPKRVLDERDYENLREDLERRDVVEYVNTQRPGTKWRVVKIVCMRFDVYKIGGR